MSGAIVGGALTLRPTGHRFRVRGNNLYTWCGFDALFLPIMLGERAEVASTCPGTGAAITLTVQPDGTVTSSAPTGVVVGIVGDDITSCCPTTGASLDASDHITSPFLAARSRSMDSMRAMNASISFADAGTPSTLRARPRTPPAGTGSSQLLVRLDAGTSSSRL